MGLAWRPVSVGRVRSSATDGRFGPRETQPAKSRVVAVGRALAQR